MKTCTRCSSIMFPCELEYCALFDTAQGWTEPAWYCPCCGDYIDKTILKNRAKQAEVVPC
jgi:hypothetical protein